jgi:hypothetical protein
MIFRGKIVAEAGEPPLVSEAEDGMKGAFLGESEYTSDSADEERFLDLSGWIGGTAVNALSSNWYTNLDAIFAAYQGGMQALADSRFWYHAEVFDQVRLRKLLDTRPAIELEKFTKLTDPALVCYYLFFPGHEEPLEGCPDSDLAKRWASCAGAWGCVAVLLQGDGNQANYKPNMIGLTTRNTGMVQFLGQELRVGMRVFDWNLATKVTHDRGPGKEQGEHARVFVSRGVHGLMIDQTIPPALTVYSPSDYSGKSCGAYETVAGETAAEKAKGDIRSEQEKLALIKVVAAGAGGFRSAFLGPAGGLGTGLVGAVASAFSIFPEIMNEFRGGMAKISGLQNADPLAPAPAQFDHPPSTAEIGVVIHPVGVDPPNVPLTARQVWPRFTPADPSDDRTLILNEGGRKYSLWVAAHSDNEDGRPVWLPSETPTTPSFKGRWGNRVVSDPFNRRVGMKFPEFWTMFFESLGM